MHKKLNLWLVPAILIGVVMCCHLGLLARLFLTRGFVDFPCAVILDTDNTCLDTSRSWMFYEGSAAQIDVYFSTYRADWNGAGCSHTPSDAPTVDVATSVKTLHLERDGEAVLVNGRRIEPGGSYEVLNWFYPHPWVTSRLFFNNLGVISNCDQDTPPRLVLVGSYGTPISLAKGGVIFLCIAAGLGIVIALLVRQERKNKWLPGAVAQDPF